MQRPKTGESDTDVKAKCSTHTACSLGYKCNYGGANPSDPHAVGECDYQTCVPRHVTADLDIVRGRGVVMALNLRPVDLDDPKSWHGCAVRSFKPVRFPVSEKAGHFQIRLPLR